MVVIGPGGRAFKRGGGGGGVCRGGDWQTSTTQLAKQPAKLEALRGV